MFILYNLLLASFAIFLAWFLIQLKLRSPLLFLCAIATLLAVPAAFIYSRFTFDLDPHGIFGLVAGFEFLATVIALLLVALYPLRSKPTLFVCIGVVAYVIGFLIALIIGMNIGLFEK